MTREDLEQALDGGLVEVAMASGWWRIRRNGRTQTWKTRPHEFRIPIKAGFRTCGELTHRDLQAGELVGGFRIGGHVRS